jgi:hypothetical protein
MSKPRLPGSSSGRFTVFKRGITIAGLSAAPFAAAATSVISTQWATAVSASTAAAGVAVSAMQYMRRKVSEDPTGVGRPKHQIFVGRLGSTPLTAGEILFALRSLQVRHNKMARGDRWLFKITADGVISGDGGVSLTLRRSIMFQSEEEHRRDARDYFPQILELSAGGNAAIESDAAVWISDQLARELQCAVLHLDPRGFIVTMYRPNFPPLQFTEGSVRPREGDRALWDGYVPPTDELSLADPDDPTRTTG